ncbi:hypothetical protein ACIQ6Y_19430 [Streptomyces sp. NPDC096205]|uniref:hypothetical protein n=1 Tax=Streptomyces sp. NPDC096205 TaxID=3366081 RepID=UPI0038283352
MNRATWPPRARRACLRKLLLLWLMDTVNILTTYLSAPAAPPLPEQGLALVDRAVDVFRMAERTSAELAAGTDTRTVWPLRRGRTPDPPTDRPL